MTAFKKKQFIIETPEKKEAIERVDRVLRQRIFTTLLLIPCFFWFKTFSNVVPTINLILALCVGVTLVIFPPVYFVKKKKNILSAKSIYLIIAITFGVELLLLFFIFYLLMPLLISHFGSVIYYPVTLFFSLYIIVSNPIFNSRIYSYFFFCLTFLMIITLAAFEYFGLYPSYPAFPVETLYRTGQLKNITFSLLFPLLIFSVIQFYIDNFWEAFRKQAKELKKLNMELEERVKERTKELQKRVNQLERFHKLTIGRELKMIELKKRIKELEKQKYNPQLDFLKKIK